MKKLIIYLTVLLIAVSCKNKKTTTNTQTESVKKTESNSATTQKIIWVNKYKIPCVGMMPTRCLQIYEGEEIKDDKWTSYFGGIEGFDFVPGKLYKLSIEEIHLDPAKVPADASSIQRKLIKVLEIIEEEEDELEGKWIAFEIPGVEEKVVANSGISVEIKSGTMGGTDGCNNIRGSFKNENGATFKLGPIMQTKKMCGGDIMETAKAFTNQLENAMYYFIQNNVLQVQNKEGMVILQFKRG